MIFKRKAMNVIGWPRHYINKNGFVCHETPPPETKYTRPKERFKSEFGLGQSSRKAGDHNSHRFQKQQALNFIVCY